MIKYVVPFLFILFATSCSSAETPVQPEDKLQEIIKLIDDNLHQDAFEQLQLHESSIVASVHESKDAASYLLLGRTYFYAEMDSKAVEALTTALELDSSLSDAHFFIGLIHRYSDDLEGAEEAFREAISVNSQDEKYFVELGRTLEGKGDSASASTVYKDALALNPASFDANVSLATIYADAGDTESAEKHYLAALEQAPNDLDAHYNLGQLYQNTTQHPLAIEQFNAVVELNPKDWRAIAKLVQENEAVNHYAARDTAIDKIYEVWRSDVDEELRDQGFYIRDQIETENGKIYVLEYFELIGERPRKYVFKLQDTQTGDIKFDVSLGSYDATTEFVRAKGKIGADERVYHLDGYSPNGSHYTYSFFYSMPTYDAVKEIALKVFADDYKAVSSTVIKP